MGKMCERLLVLAFWGGSLPAISTHLTIYGTDSYNFFLLEEGVRS